MVIAIFSLVGFECATAFGEEAKDPLMTIPRAVIVSLLLTGVFFVLVSYTEVLGFIGSKTTLDKADAPLNMLADMMNVGWLKAPDFGRCDDQLLLAGAVVPEFGRAHPLPDGPAGIFHSCDRIVASDQ